MLDVSFNVEFSIFAAGCIFPTTFGVQVGFRTGTHMYPYELLTRSLVPRARRYLAHSAECTSLPLLQAAFQRREVALEKLAVVKANIISLFHHFIFFDRMPHTFTRHGPRLGILPSLLSRVSWHAAHPLLGIAVGGKSKAAEGVRPLFMDLISHIEIYCRNVDEVRSAHFFCFEGARWSAFCVRYVGDALTVNEVVPQVCTIVDAHDGEEGANSAAHYVYDDIALICDALQKSGAHPLTQRAMAVSSGRAPRPPQ